MGIFDDERENLGFNSRFEGLELDEMFKSPEEKQQLRDVIAILDQEADHNIAVAKIQEMGIKGVKILVKVASKVLL